MFQSLIKPIIPNFLFSTNEKLFWSPNFGAKVKKEIILGFYHSFKNFYKKYLKILLKNI
jgi:hypothetical protein